MHFLRITFFYDALADSAPVGNNSVITRHSGRDPSLRYSPGTTTGV